MTKYPSRRKFIQLAGITFGTLLLDPTRGLTSEASGLGIFQTDNAQLVSGHEALAILSSHSGDFFEIGTPPTNSRVIAVVANPITKAINLGLIQSKTLYSDPRPGFTRNRITLNVGLHKGSVAGDLIIQTGSRVNAQYFQWIGGCGQVLGRRHSRSSDVNLLRSNGWDTRPLLNYCQELIKNYA